MAKRLDAGQVSKNRVVLQGFLVLKDLGRSLVLTLLREWLASKLDRSAQGLVLWSFGHLQGWRSPQHLSGSPVLVLNHSSLNLFSFFPVRIPLAALN